MIIDRFTQLRAGQITPVRAQHFIPGDHYEIEAHDFLMTFPMNTAAFPLRGRKETVSIQFIILPFGLFSTNTWQRQDPKTSAFW